MSEKVTIEIDERFLGALAITAIKGVFPSGVNISTYTVDLSKGTNIRIDENGVGWQTNQKECSNG